MEKMTKSELREKLLKKEQLALHKTSKPKNRRGLEYPEEYRYASLARAYLEDYTMFKNDVFDALEDDRVFVVITERTLYNCRQKENCIILFDSFSIVLMQIDNELFIYSIAEYKLK